MLDRSTNCLRRRGAAMKNLAYSASLHSNVKIAPSNPGIKQSYDRFEEAPLAIQVAELGRRRNVCFAAEAESPAATRSNQCKWFNLGMPQSNR